MKKNGNPWKYEDGYWYEWKKKDGKVGWVQQEEIPVDEEQQTWTDNRERDEERRFGNKLWKLSQ